MVKKLATVSAIEFSLLAVVSVLFPGIVNAFLSYYSYSATVTFISKKYDVIPRNYEIIASRQKQAERLTFRNSAPQSVEEGEGIQLDSLMDMDIVIFAKKDSRDSSRPLLELGAIQEEVLLAPLCAWTMESAFFTDSNDPK